ncbi:MULTISPECIES: nucleoside hydrolase [Mesorhizobium]|uniref:Purine nucleosidase n=1 Tax=Mesorhizobium qingshengii TaxID=1165689 RepID=A0A1G5ZWQ3_9HYPH|nr:MULTISPECIES: nucleoside hydrolase [Mesorhizobium]AID34963.1 nucleoside hydrolase [Mesorhizobium huakuii 7653R]MCH4560628.1 nucleoside hydrolase [Mesorhizobium jarvisii]SDA99115.1 purine nucleosidase [Mesorhizobium qingshengii]
MATKIILDVDTGTDDAVAIMLAALHPEIDLLAVTTVNGNVEVANCTDNTLRTLEWIGRPNIPVYEGLPRPIVRTDFPIPRAKKRDVGVHMKTLPIPEAKVQKGDLTAPNFLAKAFAKVPGEIVLVAVGPLSNVAAALAADPNFVSNVKEVMIMGGAVNKSNVTPAAEFNIWADPEAAAIVFKAGFERITLVPLDATHEALVSVEQCKEFRALGTPAGKLAADLIEHRIRGYQANQPTGVPDTAPVHDALCIAALVDRDVIETKFVNVVIETIGEFTVGRTVVDLEKRTNRPANCNVAFHANRADFVALMKRTFGVMPT